ncbi:MAG TPA: amidase family protein [Gemmatimonadaceae bacterium]|nr:amidase family protein [Gemmatimonadaceae bacterium]
MHARYLVVAALALAPVGRLAAQRPVLPPFAVEEATIADIHAAMRRGALSCRALVDRYLARIEAYDKRGPSVNAITSINPAARRIADSLDALYRRGGAVGPLHCVPVLVKDNFDTADLPTTAGSLALIGFVPARDATQVARLRAAGAIVLAKTNMAELAFTPYETVSSALPGYTRNPYALDRATAGSSGGTAAAVAASFGAVGLGTDTGNSIRGPSAHQALVGIRSTMGLTSRAGVVPLYLWLDVAGPMTRAVADAAAMLQAIAGEDPRDTVTARARGVTIPRYADSLVRDGLRGARIGVLRQAYERPTTDSQVVRVFQRALDDLRARGATVVDVTIDSLDARRRLQTGACDPFRRDFEAYLAEHPTAPVRSLEQLVQSRRFHPSIEKRLERAMAFTASPDTAAGCAQWAEFRAWLRGAVTTAMDAQRLDALVYPTWSNPPRLIGDLNTPHGDNSQLFSPNTGYPALTVPMGYTRGVLPAGMTFFGRAWSEGTLIRLAYAYEQATKHRRPPALMPALR